MLRSRVGVAVTGGKLYAFGGFNGTERLSTVEIYDRKLRKWSQGRSMMCKRSAVGVAALNDLVYVCGGYDGVTSLNTGETSCNTLHAKSWGHLYFSKVLLERAITNPKLQFIRYLKRLTNN